jgi:hypothetical protein
MKNVIDLLDKALDYERGVSRLGGQGKEIV